MRTSEHSQHMATRASGRRRERFPLCRALRASIAAPTVPTAIRDVFTAAGLGAIGGSSCRRSSTMPNQA